VELAKYLMGNEKLLFQRENVRNELKNKEDDVEKRHTKKLQTHTEVNSNNSKNTERKVNETVTYI